MQINNSQIPEFVRYVSETLESAGFSAYLVGGCVRDLLIGRIPKDFDITTSATPEDIIKIFPKTVYENVFGTVLVVDEDLKDYADSKKTEGPRVSSPDHSVVFKPASSDFGNNDSVFSVEVTPFRKEGKYTDRRHPDNVVFSKDINDDLSRRDFTINAMAYRLATNELIDLFNGQPDLDSKTVRTVGDADERFNEDPLRLMRAVRFATELGFSIEANSMMAIAENSELLKHISIERIRDEFIKIINSDSPASGIEMLRRFSLLPYIIPELLDGVGCVQGGAHKYDVYEHLLHALQHASDKKFSFHIRLSALFHDIGKPKSRRESNDKNKKQYTFYGHEVIGAKMAKKIMERMKFPKNDVDLVYKFVRYHMFFSDTEVITLSPVRRMIANVGVDHIWELMQIRECDRVGMAKNEAPYRLRKYHAMIEQALRDPISVKQLKINGDSLKDAGINPGPRMGWILLALLEEVIEDPSLNTEEYLLGRVAVLNKLTDIELRKLGDEARSKKDELEEEEVSRLHAKHNVKK